VVVIVAIGAYFVLPRHEMKFEEHPSFVLEKAFTTNNNTHFTTSFLVIDGSRRVSYLRCGQVASLVKQSVTSRTFKRECHSPNLFSPEILVDKNAITN
jgi:hypothetical protein